MPLDKTSPLPRVGDLLFLNDGGSTFGENDGLFREGSADRAGVGEGIYRYIDGKLRPVLVDGEYTPASSQLAISAYDRPEPGFLEAAGAAWRTKNMIGSGFASRALSYEEKDFFKVQPGYDVFDDIKGYEPYVERFEQVYNPVAAQAVKADIDREKKDRQVLAASGMTGVALSVGASVLDPTILIPGGAVVRAGRLGYSVGKTALNVGAHAGAATAVQEVALHSSQQLRTAEESFLAVGGSMILGGVIGTAGARFIEQKPEAAD